MTMITPSYLGETIEYSSLHACRSTLEDPTLLMLAFALFLVLIALPTLLLVRHFMASSLDGCRHRLPASMPVNSACNGCNAISRPTPVRPLDETVRALPHVSISEAVFSTLRQP